MIFNGLEEILSSADIKEKDIENSLDLKREYQRLVKTLLVTIVNGNEILKAFPFLLTPPTLIHRRRTFFPFMPFNNKKKSFSHFAIQFFQNGVSDKWTQLFYAPRTF